MTEEESIKEREFHLYKYLRHAAQEDTLLINEEGWKMSIILKLTKQGVSNIRSRLYMKFIGKKGNGLMFDEFVRNL